MAQTSNKIDDIALARREAQKLQRDHPAIFGKTPVPVSDLANILGFSVEKRSELRQRARLEIVVDQGAEIATIAVRDGLDRNVSRFAVAHEIGHAILLKRHPDVARQWDVDRREAFASTFAAEILTSSEVRKQTAALFRALTDPLSLLKLASQLGLSPVALLTIAARESSWIEGLDKIWLRVKYIENAFTHADPKLRIVSACYDRVRFYIATNQSLARFAGDDPWLDSMPIGSVSSRGGLIVLKFKRLAPLFPKFVSKTVPAKLSAVRLHPNVADPSAYLIILANLESRT